jgi:hypothetical protein
MGAIFADIPQIPVLLNAIFRLIEAHRNEVWAQSASLLAYRLGCSPRGSGTRGMLHWRRTHARAGERSGLGYEERSNDNG